MVELRDFSTRVLEKQNTPLSKTTVVQEKIQSKLPAQGQELEEKTVIGKTKSRP